MLRHLNYLFLVCGLFNIVLATAFGATTAELKITINDQVFHEKAQFSKDNHFSVQFLVADAPTPVFWISVKSGEIGQEYLRISYTEASPLIIDVTIEYPDPFFTPVVAGNIGWGELSLFLDNEEPEVVSPILGALAEESRLDLLRLATVAMKQQHLQQYFEDLVIGAITLGLEDAMDDGILLLQRLAEHQARDDRSIAVGFAVLGKTDPSGIRVLQTQVRADFKLKSFVRKLRQKFPDDEIIAFLLQPEH